MEFFNYLLNYLPLLFAIGILLWVPKPSFTLYNFKSDVSEGRFDETKRKKKQIYMVCFSVCLS